MAEIGKYIVLEGGDNVGKTTQARIIADSIGAVVVSEPGVTPLGERVRSILLDPKTAADKRTEVFLHAAARAQLIPAAIMPQLEAGVHVVSDRSWVSSAVYQQAQGVDAEDIEMVNRFAIGEYVNPDLLIILDADPQVVKSRSVQPPDRYEQLSAEFHSKVRANYLEIGQRLGAVILDATASKKEVGQKIRIAVSKKLEI
jgi:dTMP kinase